MSKRPDSIQAALLKLERSQENTPVSESPVVQIKPSYSKISLVEQAGELEITLSALKLRLKQDTGNIAPVLLSTGLLFCLPFAMFLLIWSPSLFLLPALSPIFLVLVKRMLSRFATARVVVTEETVSITRKLFRLNYDAQPFSAKRRYLWKLALSDLGGHLCLWAGTEKIEFFGTREEMAWLAYELSNWLELPIERD